MRFFGSKKGKIGPEKEKGASAGGMDRGFLIGIEKPKVEDDNLAAQAKKLNDEGMECYSMNDFDGARQKFEEATRIDPEYAEPYHHLFAVYQKQGDLAKSFEAAAKFVQFADPSNPATKELKELLSLLKHRPGSRDFQVLAQNLEIPDNPGSLCLEAIGHAKAKRYDKALLLFERAVALNPDYGAGWSDMGLCLLEMGQHSDAIEVLLKASHLLPNDVSNWAYLALAYMLANKGEKAQECIEKCRQLGASDEFISNVRAKYFMMLRSRGGP